MKKIYIILILVVLLSGSGVGILIWFKKKKKKSSRNKLETGIEEELPIVEAPEPPEEKPTESKVKSEIPKELLSDISIDYVDINKRELSYSMHYKGVSHKGTFKEGDKDTFVIKSFGRFVVVKPNNRMQEEPAAVDKNVVSTRVGALNPKAKAVGSITAKDFYQDSFVYLAIYNKRQLVTGLKVNLQTGEQIEGLPTEWSQLED
jgi:hypothetical protein